MGRALPISFSLFSQNPFNFFPVGHSLSHRRPSRCARGSCRRSCFAVAAASEVLTCRQPSESSFSNQSLFFPLSFSLTLRPSLSPPQSSSPWRFDAARGHTPGGCRRLGQPLCCAAKHPAGDGRGQGETRCSGEGSLCSPLTPLSIHLLPLSSPVAGFKISLCRIGECSARHHPAGARGGEN